MCTFIDITLLTVRLVYTSDVLLGFLFTVHIYVLSPSAV